LLGLLPAALLVLADQLRAFKLVDRVAQDDVLKLKRFGFLLPCSDLRVCELELAVQLTGPLLEGIDVGRHFDALLSEERD